MSPRNDSQNEKIRQERKLQIMNVALEVIAEKGFSNASIATIAKTAGISKGLMYNYFASKEELISSIMLHGFNQLTTDFDPDKNGQLNESELHLFIDSSFDQLESNIPFWRMYFMVLLQPEVFNIIGEEFEKTVEPFMATAMTYFTNNGYENPVAEVRFFAAMMDGVGLHFILDPENFPLEAVKKKIHRIFINK